MAEFSVNAKRFDPYENFKFRIKWDGRFVSTHDLAFKQWAGKVWNFGSRASTMCHGPSS